MISFCVPILQPKPIKKSSNQSISSSISEEAEVFINSLFNSTKGTKALASAPEADCFASPAAASLPPDLLVETKPAPQLLCMLPAGRVRLFDKL
ncbi:hypothetical protein L873DRAFT_330971 [Choiromyces venosus 120613-1]|uniref:Uncharacterized protein n=1 Tax=Choiromyces venosus 120613-1 TaxID=1336337 RepID=A0A3N4K195_9PEZI|nr:hypothetical protein L873DRAFT_330971 [Choiromyces venosus 120613-1]